MIASDFAGVMMIDDTGIEDQIVTVPESWKARHPPRPRVERIWLADIRARAARGESRWQEQVVTNAVISRLERWLWRHEERWPTNRHGTPIDPVYVREFYRKRIADF